jgi:conjugative transfer pilus assembly protein TraH
MREPSKNYSLVARATALAQGRLRRHRSLRGSFSFINKAQFVALLQNIGANAVGYAFKLALQSISPDIDKLLPSFRTRSTRSTP